MTIEDMKIAVVGAGTMGQGIGLSFALGGFSVQLIDADSSALERASAQTEVDLRLLEKERFLGTAASVVRSRLTLTTDMVLGVRDADLVIEAVTEILEVKKQLFARLEELCHGDTILATNTSSLKVSDVGRELRNPGRFLGAHFFNPAHIIPLVEIIPPFTEEPGRALEITRQVMKKIGKKEIIVRKEAPGFIVNRITSAINREIHYMVEEGIATPEEIDTATRASIGMRYACMGPFEITDLAGMDTGIRVGEQLYKTLNNSVSPSQIIFEKVRRGELGVKTGKGWYDYSGRSREEILEERNRKLLQRLILFNREEAAKDNAYET